MQEIGSINIMEKFSLFEKQWTPHIIGELINCAKSGGTPATHKWGTGV